MFLAEVEKHKSQATSLRSSLRPLKQTALDLELRLSQRLPCCHGKQGTQSECFSAGLALLCCCQHHMTPPQKLEC